MFGSASQILSYLLFVNPHDLSTHILQSWFTGAEPIMKLPSLVSYLPILDTACVIHNYVYSVVINALNTTQNSREYTENSVCVEFRHVFV